MVKIVNENSAKMIAINLRILINLLLVLFDYIVVDWLLGFPQRVSITASFLSGKFTSVVNRICVIRSPQELPHAPYLPSFRSFSIACECESSMAKQHL
jgi:hypothetical protein